MSAEDFEPLKRMTEARRELRRQYAVACPVCVNRLPRAHPTMLLPQERCRMHGYKDMRDRIPREKVDAIFAQFGLERTK